MALTREQCEELYNTQGVAVAERIARVLFSQLGPLNGMTIDDFRQAAAMGIWKSLPKYQADLGKFDSWASNTARRGILDEVRSCNEVGRSRRADGIVGAVHSLEERAFSADAAGGVPTLHRNLIAASRPVDRRAAYEGIERLLAGLDERQRTVVFLMDVMELEDFAVGAVLDLPEATVAAVRAEALGILGGKPPPAGRRKLKSKLQRNSATFATTFPESGPLGPLFTDGLKSERIRPCQKATREPKGAKNHVRSQPKNSIAGRKAS